MKSAHRGIEWAREVSQECGAKRRKALIAQLKQCGTAKDLHKVKQFHAEATRNGDDSSIYLAPVLVNVYAKCGSMNEAHRVLNGVKQPNLSLWTALIAGYVENGQGQTALDLFTSIKTQGFAPDSFLYVAVFKAFASIAIEQDERGKADCLERGRQIHSEVGCHFDIYVESILVDMYAKCGSMSDARLVFDEMKQRNVVSWTALITGYVENGEAHTALDMFAKMKSVGCTPNYVTFVAALKACSALAVGNDGVGKEKCLEMGKQIHAEIGFHPNMHVRNTLVDMYSKCGSMSDARQVFDSIRQPDLVAWNVLIMGYAEIGDWFTALDLYASVKSQGFQPDSVTYVAALKACTSLADKDSRECLKLGKTIHLEIGSLSNNYVQCTLIDMYAKCGCMVEARKVFNGMKNPSIVSWNALMSAYIKSGEARKSLDLFGSMENRNSISFIVALKACASLAQDQGGRRQAECLELGKQIHSSINCPLDIYLMNTLVDMYAKCGSMLDSHQVFRSIENPCVISWNTLLMGYVNNEDGVTALELFASMRSPGYIPNRITFVAALKACALLGDFITGSKIHAEIESQSAYDTILVTCLVDFYAKCGNMAEATRVFHSHVDTRNLTTWNALLAGYSRLGDNGAVVDLFEAMRVANAQPDAVTFLSILSCCSHAGLVEKANEYFDAMKMLGITPNAEHYNCMVDILGRSNKLDDAIALLRDMACRPNVVTWKTVLASCRKLKNVGVGTLAFKSLVSLDDTYGTAYVLISQIYRSRGMREGEMALLRMRGERKACFETEESCWRNDEDQVN